MSLKIHTKGTHLDTAYSQNCNKGNLGDFNEWSYDQNIVPRQKKQFDDIYLLVFTVTNKMTKNNFINYRNCEKSSSVFSSLNVYSNLPSIFFIKYLLCLKREASHALKLSSIIFVILKIVKFHNIKHLLKKCFTLKI